MYKDIDELKAKEAAVQASLMYGTVRPSSSERIKGLITGCILLLVLWAVGFYLLVLTHTLIVWVVVTMISGFHLALSRLGETITYDGESGMITCRSFLRRTQTFHMSEITDIWRTCEQVGENDAHWVRYGRNMHLSFSAAHYTDYLCFAVNGKVRSVILRKSMFGKTFKGYEGGDDGVEAFDRYLRLYERSRKPDPPDEDVLFEQRLHPHSYGQQRIEMPSIN